VIAVHSNYLVATYIQRQTTCKLEKERRKRKEKETITLMDNRIAILLYSTDMEFLLFSIISLFVEMVSPIRTSVSVCLMVFFTIDIFENMRTRLAFLYSKP